MKTYRTNGALGALLDEYDKAIKELINLVKTLNKDQISTIVDHQTKDEDCRSIHTIISHVVNSGHSYLRYIRNHLGESLIRNDRQIDPNAIAYESELKKLMEANNQVGLDYPNMPLEQLAPHEKITTSWGQSFDIEQLLEHAIVHILRHRRQIERFLILLNK